MRRFMFGVAVVGLWMGLVPSAAYGQAAIAGTVRDGSAASVDNAVGPHVCA